MRDVVQKLVFGVDKSKSTAICSYIFHLYNSLDMMKGEEITMY